MSREASHPQDGVRPLSDWEQRLLAFLLQSSFALAAQSLSVRARTVDADGSLELYVDDSYPPASVQRRVPVEAETPDADGMIVHILLHVLDGAMVELEIYREDSKPVQGPLDLASAVVLT